MDAIVHGGGLSGPMMRPDEPVAITEINVLATAALLDIARRHGVGQVVFMSSHVIYGECGTDLLAEDRALRPATTYAASKVAGEALVQSFRAEFGLSAASLRLTRVYGPFRRGDCLLRRIALDAAAGRETVIPYAPDHAYHYVSVEDVAAATLACLQAPELPHAAYNVTSGEPLQMPEIADIARAVLPGATLRLVAGPGDVPEVQQDFDLSAIAADTGWRPRWRLAEGYADYLSRLG